MALIEVTDQLGNKLRLKSRPKRIISLVPSITEYLFHLGLEKSVIGITTFCVEPSEKIAQITKIGGTKTFDVDAILNLNCDLVIANKEENVKEKIEEIQPYVPTYVSDVNNMSEAVKMMKDTGSLVGKSLQAETLISKIKANFTSIIESNQPKKRVVYLIWQNPIMIAAKNCFISEVISECGFENVGEQLGVRYPSVTVEDIKALDPDIIVLSSEPYRFNQVHINEWKDLIPLATVILADATYFSWYGNRLEHSAQYITDLLNNAE